jgi:transcriptional regulator with XRE-family HTH domain
MVRAKATDPRNGRPSWNRLAELAGVSTSTITLMVEGRRQTSLATVRKVAEALRVSPAEVAKWLGREQDVRPYDVPAEVDLLTERQQKALTELIRAIAADTTGGEHGGDTAATSVTQLTPREQLQQVQKKAARRPSKD